MGETSRRRWRIQDIFNNVKIWPLYTWAFYALEDGFSVCSIRVFSQFFVDPYYESLLLVTIWTNSLQALIMNVLFNFRVSM